MIVTFASLFFGEFCFELFLAEGGLHFLLPVALGVVFEILALDGLDTVGFLDYAARKLFLVAFADRSGRCFLEGSID